MSWIKVEDVERRSKDIVLVDQLFLVEVLVIEYVLLVNKGNGFVYKVVLKYQIVIEDVSDKILSIVEELEQQIILVLYLNEKDFEEFFCIELLLLL